MTADWHQDHRHEDLAAQRHNEVIEQLHRINIGLEALNRTLEHVSRQLADVVARAEAALQYAGLAGDTTP
jgi:exo-beta-1,3-glucanase (GH17 family)